MPLHFKREEFRKRLDCLKELMSSNKLDGILLFRQESMFYLTGYDTFGYVFFQCLYLGIDGKLILLTRLPDLRQAQQTSIVEDIRIWVDGETTNPALELKEILRESGSEGKSIGVEYDSYGVTAKNGKMLESGLDGFCKLTDASDLGNPVHQI